MINGGKRCCEKDVGIKSMTPEREKYFDKCKVRELWLRGLIKTHKEAIKKAKEQLNYGVFDSDGQVAVCKSAMRVNKWLVASLRHELNHIKGMGRVVVPKRIFIDNYCGISTKCTCCKCGRLIPHFENYCSDCGRKILWERVTK